MRYYREARVVDLWLNTELKIESDEGFSDLSQKLKFYEEWPERFLVFRNRNLKEKEQPCLTASR